MASVEVAGAMASAEVAATPVSVPELVKQRVSTVPEAYIRFPDGYSGATSSAEASIPVIDMSAMKTIPGRERLVQEIRQACEKWGFFHVVNHSVEQQTMKEILQAEDEFFNLPAEEKMKLFSSEPKMNGTRYGLRFTNSGVQDWRDFLDMGKCYPFTDEVMSTWPENPPSFRVTALKYVQQIRKLALEILSLLSEGLGLPPDRLEKVLPSIDQTLLSNRYLPCPQPELVLGVRNHSDPGLITLLHTNEVPGLQVKSMSDSSWLTVLPQPGSIIVNLGDQMEILSNKRLRSVEHRALASSGKTRYSIASFFIPPADAVVEPLPELVDEDHPPLYRAVRFREYVNIYVEQKLASKQTLEVLQTDSSL